MEMTPVSKRPTRRVCPETWKNVILGDLTTKIGSGITPRGGSSNYLEYGRPFVRSQNVGWGNLLLDDLVYIDEEIHRSFSATELEEGDVLLNITGASIGRTAVVSDNLVGGNVNQHVCIIRVDQAHAIPQFINYVLLSSLGQKQIDSFQAGGNRQGLNFSQIRSIKIDVPPTRAEQEAIAGALSDADALIESLEQLITKKRQIKQGAMQELLTGKRRLPGFKGKWETKKLGDIVDVDPENLGAETKPNFHFNYISLEDVDTGLLQKYSEQSFSSAPSRARRRLRQSDVLVSTVRPNLKSHLFFTSDSGNWVCSTGFSVLRCKPELSHAGYIYFHLFASIIERQIEALISGSNYPAINSRDVRELRIPLPKYAEQSEIANILSDIEGEVAALEEKLTKAKALKQGMMQELLTGRIRLV